jgi:N6-adenosine-specific RNA methylase IME4
MSRLVQVEHGRVPGAAPEPGVVTVRIATLRRKPNREVSRAHVKWLAESFEEVGQLHPIVIDPAQNVLAGEHRIQAAEELGWKRINAVVLTLDQLRAKLATLDENLVRNPGTELERSEQLRQRKEIYEALHPETAHGGTRPGAGRKSSRQNGDSKETAAAAPRAERFSQDVAAKTGDSERSIQRRVQVAEDLDPRAKTVIAKTPLADQITELEQLAKLEPEKQVEVAKRAVEAGTTVKRTVKDLRREKQVELIKKYVPPVGKYPVVVRDPAWPYKDKLEGDGARGGTPYPQATIEEICAQVPPMDEDCVVFLWCTNQHLIDLDAPVQRVMRAWGVIPKALVTWKKPRMGLGRYVRNITEQFVIAVRGRPVLDLPDSTSWLEGDVGEHSEKPESFYALVEHLCPARPIFEGDARERPVERPGWVRSGAELPEKAAPARSHLWERQNPLSAPARALYKCLACDAKHHGQDPMPPGDGCPPKELAGAAGPATPTQTEVIWWLHAEGATVSHAYPGRDTETGGYTGPEVSDATEALCGADRPAREAPGGRGDEECPGCATAVAERRRAAVHRGAGAAAKPAGGWTFEWRRKGKGGVAHAFGAPLAGERSACGAVRPAKRARSETVVHERKGPFCSGCERVVEADVRDRGAVDPLAGPVRAGGAEQPTGIPWLTGLAHGAVAHAYAGGLAGRSVCDVKIDRKRPATKSDERCRKCLDKLVWEGRSWRLSKGHSALAHAVGYIGDESGLCGVVLGPYRGQDGERGGRAKARDQRCPRCVEALLSSGDHGRAQQRVREVPIKAGSYRQGLGGGQCVSVSTRPPGDERCRGTAQAVVKASSGRLFNVCARHGQKAMRDRVLRVALEGA